MMPDKEKKTKAHEAGHDDKKKTTMAKKSPKKAKKTSPKKAKKTSPKKAKKTSPKKAKKTSPKKTKKSPKKKTVKSNTSTMLDDNKFFNDDVVGAYEYTFKL
jgi:hypothetical protein